MKRPRPPFEVEGVPSQHMLALVKNRPRSVTPDDAKVLHFSTVIVAFKEKRTVETPFLLN